MKPAATLLLLLACSHAGAEIYKWTDENGRLHFGDSAAGAGKPAQAVTPRSATGTVPEAARRPDDARSAQERQRRLLDMYQREATEREAAARAEAERKSRQDLECERLRRILANMEGRAVFVRGSDGEPQFLDDNQRQAYVDKTTAYLRENCQ